MSAVVALVGRPNVGKSTLFNRLVGRREAITLRNPGITRDRLYGTVNWLDKNFTLIDTGGFIPNPEQPLQEQMRHQVHLAIKEAELVILAVDGKEGLHPGDKTLADILRKKDKPYLVVVNKSDVKTAEWEHHTFHVLGGEELFLVSAEHGVGFGELLEGICARLSFEAEEDVRPEVKILIAGRPNAGKSTLLNTLVGEERSVVDAAPGTTRDPVDTCLEVEGMTWRLIDTAGLRRRTRIKEDVEYYATSRLRKAIARSDVILLLIDLSEGLSRQDKRLAREVVERRKDLVLVFNKVDLLDQQALRNKLDAFSWELKGLEHFFRVLSSGLKRAGIDELVKTVSDVVEKRSRRIPKELLGEFLQQITRQRPPGHRVKIYRLIQKPGPPPLFLAETNRPAGIDEFYLRFLTNRLREAFDLEGTNLKLELTQRRKK